MDQWTHMQCDDNETQSLVKLAKKIKDKRYCRECMKMLPLEQIKPKSFFCHQHYKMLLKWSKSKSDPIRHKCSDDRTAFAQPHIELSNKQISKLMTTDQLDNKKLWCIVPLDPTRILAEGNAVVVTSVHRRFLVTQWVQTHDVLKYQRSLTLKKMQ